MIVAHASPPRLFRAECLGRCTTCGSVSHPRERQGNPGRMGLPCGHPLTALEPICPAEARKAPLKDLIRWRGQIRTGLQELPLSRLHAVAQNGPSAPPVHPVSVEAWAWNAVWHAATSTRDAADWLTVVAQLAWDERTSVEEVRCAA